MTTSELGAGAESIVRRLREAGHEAVYAGGCVRDLLRGVVPNDYDIATNAPPDEVRRLFPRSEAVGAHFGVIIVKVDGHHYEVATFREDGDYRDGRRPAEVRFADAERDAQRRDFTINGIFYDPVSEEFIDFVGGRADVEAGVIRAIGDPAARFREDHLRLMRAIRLATTLGFSVDPPTWEAVCAEAPRLRMIAIERVRDELVRTLEHRHRLRGFDLLCESGLMEVIIPEILALKGCEQPPEFHPEGDVFVHTRLMLSLLPAEASFPLVLATLLHDIGKPATQTWDPAVGRVRFNEHDKIGARMTEEILRRLRFSNEVIESTTAMVGRHMAFMNVQQMRTSRLKRFMAPTTFPDELELHRVDCLASHGWTDNYEFLKARQHEFGSEPLIPPRLVTGNDLMALGFKAGPQLGAVLRDLETLQLEGQLTSRDEALVWARGRLASGVD